ncbi:hypothetical protein GIS00_23180 [Nakamurella sp. YIM 132087]|uniref:Uncharacterized protein n=1 Tax=Nakamurella alba TaxID=2665158 RepID=A0A7K1FRS5_9ACTN|nr:hypothetical protein [Nakamurella alba]MTD16841.1 hypothetical protein [Nakamurella alba]
MTITQVPSADNHHIRSTAPEAEVDVVGADTGIAEADLESATGGIAPMPPAYAVIQGKGGSDGPDFKYLPSIVPPGAYQL